MSEYLPVPSDVAALLRARTYLDNGEQEGEFTTETRPTTAQVVLMIAQAYGEVSARVGQDIEEASRLFAYARSIVALRAAMAIELSYFPEQADEDRDTLYKELRTLYEEGLMFLINALPDTESSMKGIYSIPLRSEALDLTENLLL